MTQKKVRPAAIRVFHTKYLPFILEEYLKVAPVSYATIPEIKDAWRTQHGYSEKVANHLEMQSKVFLTVAFPNNDPRRFDIEMLDDLTDIIAGYLAPYFCQAAPGTTKANVKERLKRILFTENTSIIRNKQKNAEIAEKQMKRMAAKEAEQAIVPERKRRIITIKKAYDRSVYAVRIDIPGLTQKVK